MKKTLSTSVLFFITILTALGQKGNTYHIFGTIKNPANKTNLSLSYYFKKSDYQFSPINLNISNSKFDFRYKLAFDSDSLILFNNNVRFAKGLKDTTIDFGELDIDKSYAVIYYEGNACSKTRIFNSNYCYSSVNIINSYYWVFDDSTTSKLQNPTKWFKRIGNHKVTLEITDNSGKFSKTIDFTINDTCQANTVFLKFKTKNQVPLNGTISFNGQDTFNYDGKSKVYIKKLKPIFTSIDYFSMNYKSCKGKGTYSHNLLWKTGIDTIDLGTLEECPCNVDFKFSGDDKQQFVGFINTTIASNINYAKVKWTFGDGDTITKFDGTNSYYNQVYHKYVNKGSYKVKMDFLGNEGCQGSIEKTIYYKDTCTTLIYLRDTGSNWPASNGSVLFMSANYLWPGVDSTKWDLGDGNTSSKSSLIHGYSSIKNYKLCAKTWQGGCVSSTCTTINVQNIAPCRAHFEIVKDPNNKFGLLLKDKSMVTNAQYIWNIYDYHNRNYISFNEPIFEHNFNEFGTYNINLEIDDPAVKCNSRHSEIFSFDSTGKLLKKTAFTLKVLDETNRNLSVKRENKLNFNIYPIPADDELIINTDGLIQQIMIFDNLGRNIQTIENINTPNCSIDVSLFKSGFYSLYIIASDKLYNRKILIK